MTFHLYPVCSVGSDQVTCFLARSSRACVFICCTSSESNRRRRTNRSWFPMHSWRICANHKPTWRQSASLHRPLGWFPSSRSTRTHQLVDSLPRGVELEDVCFLVQRFDGELSRANTYKPSIRPFTINTDGQIVCLRSRSSASISLPLCTSCRMEENFTDSIFQSVSQFISLSTATNGGQNKHGKSIMSFSLLTGTKTQFQKIEFHFHIVSLYFAALGN